MDIRSSSSLRRKNFKYKILLDQNFRKLKNYNNTAIKHTSQYSYNNSTGSSMPEPFSIRGKKEMEKKVDCH
jgi:hypothetical protein